MIIQAFVLAMENVSEETFAIAYLLGTKKNVIEMQLVENVLVSVLMGFVRIIIILRLMNVSVKKGGKEFVVQHQNVVKDKVVVNMDLVNV